MKVISSTQTQLLLRQRRIIPEVWELTTPAPKIKANMMVGMDEFFYRTEWG